MDTYSVSEESIAMLLPKGMEKQLASIIRNSLLLCGIRPWKSVEAELFEMGDRVLLLARPTPPLTRRTGDKILRLRRHLN